jgi:hypothetical protein
MTYRFNDELIARMKREGRVHDSFEHVKKYGITGAGIDEDEQTLNETLKPAEIGSVKATAASAKHPRDNKATKSTPAHTRGRMNKTEAAYADILEQQKQAGDIQAYYFERVTLTLTFPRDGGRGMTYTPDFAVKRNDGGTTLIEVKGGFIREDSRDKFKMARELFGDAFTFSMVQRTDKNHAFHKVTV